MAVQRKGWQRVLWWVTNWSMRLTSCLTLVVDVTPIGSAGEVEFYGHGEAATKVTKFHVPPVPSGHSVICLLQRQANQAATRRPAP